jgi:D-serine deaminase-like pyridoxal phosphate-dependent protein
MIAQKALPQAMAGVAAAAVAAASLLWWLAQTPSEIDERSTVSGDDTWSAGAVRRLVDALALDGDTTPLVLVRRDLLLANAREVARVVRQDGNQRQGAGSARPVTVRLATKSLRCVPLLAEVLASAPNVFRGLMAYSAAEAAHLACHPMLSRFLQPGNANIIVAYPTVARADVQAVHLARAHG